MAYFSNGTEGMAMEKQCAACKYGNDPCPIAWVQYNYNYDACNNKTARAILNELIADSGTCSMFETFKKDLKL